jgi:hypothetical protein
MIAYSSDFFVDRLVKEWLKHERLIIAVDLDDTIIPYNPELTESCKEVVALLKDCESSGTVLIINTARQESKHESSMQQVRDLGLNPTAINKTPEWLDLPFGKAGKVYANIFLDDRGGLATTTMQLRRAHEIVKHIREQESIEL